MTNLVSLKSMASSLPRKLYGGSFTRYIANAKTSLVSFCTKSLSSAEREAHSDSDCDFETTCLSSSNQLQFTSNTARTLKNGLDLDIYKFILDLAHHTFKGHASAFMVKLRSFNTCPLITGKARRGHDAHP